MTTGASLETAWKARIILRLASDGRIVAYPASNITPEVMAVLSADRTAIAILLEAAQILAIRATAGRPKRRRGRRQPKPPVKPDPRALELLRGFYEQRLVHWGTAIDCTRWQVEQLAFCETLSAYWFHLRPAERPDGGCCGCRRPLEGCRDILDLPNGLQVHHHDLDCLTRYGNRWRKQAVADLAALNFPAPIGFVP
jgi:hypothetical protein